MTPPLPNAPTRFGLLHIPLHRIGVSPTLQLERDLQLITFAEELGFSEAFVGEHHSVGHEIVAVPEIFLAAAAERTKQIRLGSAVVSVPYHHPFHVAERAVLMDHLSRGRYILGVGPGSLAADSYMLGIDSQDSRRMLMEGLDAIVKLLEGEVVSLETDWFKLHEARLQLNSYQLPRIEMQAAAVASPSGPRAAGKYGMGMIGLAALNSQSFDAMRGHWEIVEQEAAKSGRSVSRDTWRLCAVLHLADTEEQAAEDLRYGLEEWLSFQRKIALFPPIEGDTFEELLEGTIAESIITIGTPDTAIDVINRLTEQSGGFGCFCVTLVDFVNYAAQRHSLELFAEHVIPHFRHQLDARFRSREFAIDELGGGRKEWEAAIVKATEEYAHEGAQIPGPTDCSGIRPNGA